MKAQRFIKLTLYGLLGILALAALAVTGGFFWLQTSSAREQVLALLKEQIKSELGYDVKIEGLSFSLPADISATRLTLADKDGVWLEASAVSIGILPSWNIRHAITIYKLSAESLHLNYAPGPTPPTPPGAAAGPDFTLLSIKINTLELPTVLTGLDTDLELSLSGNATYHDKDETLHFSFSGTAPLFIVPQLNDAQFSFSGIYIIPTDQLMLESLQLDAQEHLQLEGKAAFDLAQETYNTQLKAQLVDLSQWQPQMQGSASGEVEAIGSFDNPAIAASGVAQHLSYAQNSLPDVTWGISAQQTGKQINGEIKLKGSNNELEFTANYLWNQSTLALSRLSGAYSGCTAAGDVSVQTEILLAEGVLSGACADLSVLTPYVPQLNSGSASYTAKLAQDGKHQAVDVTLDAKELVTSEGSAHRLHADASFRDLFHMLVPEKLSAKASGISAQGHTIDEASLTLSPQQDHWQFSNQLTGTEPMAYKLNGAGSISIAGKDLSLSLRELNGTVSGRHISLAKPAQLDYASGVLVWDIAQASIEATRLSTKGTVKDEVIDAQAQFEKLTPANWASVPPQLQGAIADGKAALSGTLATPTLHLTASIANVALLDNNAPLTIPLTVDYAKGSAHLTIEAMQKDLLRGKADITLPATFTLKPFVAQLQEDGALSGTLVMDGKLPSLAHLFLPVEHYLIGSVGGALNLGGTVKTPSVKGDIVLSNGRYQYPPLGLTLENLGATLHADGTRLTLKNASARDKKGHVLNLEGNADLAGNLHFMLRATMKDMALLNHPNAQGLISGDLIVEGDRKSALVKGTLVPRPVEIRIPEKLENDLPQLNVVEQKKKNAPRPQTYSVKLDITVDASEQVFVRGWGVDAEIGGRLVIGGTATEPEVRGKLTTKRGRYEEFGKQFAIKEGSLTFEGDMPPSPYLNIVASIAAGDVEVMPTISGPLLDPKLSVESIPSLPQDEALSRLLFGKDARNISPVQAVQLANSLRKLSGHGASGFNPLARARELLGVDDLNVNNDGDTADTTVGVGKYLRDDVYLEIERGAESGSGRARIEVELTPSISLESTTGEAGQSSVGVNWKRDY